MHSPDLRTAGELTASFGAFVLEQYPFAAAAAAEVFEHCGASRAQTPDEFNRIRPTLEAALRRRLETLVPEGVGETTPGVPPARRFSRAVDDVAAACDGFLRRAAIRASLTASERLEILRGMLLTRATDNRLKALFTSGEVRFRNVPFQGK